MAVALVVTGGLIGGGVLLAREQPPPRLPALALDGRAADSGTAAVATEVARPPDFVRPARYKVRGDLPDLPGEGPAFALRAPGDVPARVAELAAALGVRGQVNTGERGWSVGGRLRVGRAPGLPWHFGTADACVTTDLGGAQGGADDAVGCAVPPRRPAPDLPSAADAERAARELLARTGLDLDGARVRVREAPGAQRVTVEPAVAGLPASGFAWTVAVGAKSAVTSASGWLATPEPAGDYPLIGVDEALRRLREPPRRILPQPRGQPGCEPDSDGREPACVPAQGPDQPSAAAPPASQSSEPEPDPAGSGVAEPARPGTKPVPPGTVVCIRAPCPGGPVPKPPPSTVVCIRAPCPGEPSPGEPSPIPPPSRDRPCAGPPCPGEPRPPVRTIVDARLGLALAPPLEHGASAYLIPAYLFELDGGDTIRVIAVQDRFLTDPGGRP